MEFEKNNGRALMETLKVEDNQRKYLSDSAYLCASIARFSGNLNKVADVSQIASYSHSFLSEQKLNGFLRIKSTPRSYTYMLNNGCRKRDFFNFNQSSVSKVQQLGTALYFKTSSIDLFLQTGSYQQDKKDLLMDVIAMFVDIVETVIKQREYIDQIKREFEVKQVKIEQQMYESLRLIKRSNSRLIETYQHIVDDLFCSLTAKLPALALESDQEEFLLNLVEAHCQKHHLHISNHVECNQLSADEIAETLALLLCSQDLNNDHNPQFDNKDIVLF